MTGKFFGRKQQLELLTRRVSALKDGYRQNIAFVGDELTGKSSLLFEFLANFCDSRFVTVYLEARPETVESFCRRFIAALLYNFLLPGNQGLKRELDYLLEKSSGYLPRTVEKARQVLADAGKKKKEHLFTDLLSLTESVYGESGKFCVVICDEFHMLERLGIKKMYKEWSQLLMLQKHTLYIIASSAVYKARVILSRDLSLLFGNFEVVTLEPFDSVAACQFLDARLGSAVDQGSKNFIAHFTGGNPFYLQVLCDGVSAAGQNAGLIQILESLLFDTTGILHQRFSNYLKKYEDMANGQDYAAILHHVSSGNNKIKDIAHSMRRVKSDIAARASYLIETDALRKSGDFLLVSDRVFGFWLKFVYQEKMNSVTCDSESQKAVFKKRLETMFQEFAVYSGKPVAQRIAELFRLFSDERVQMERKSLKLSRFREVKHLEFGSSRLRDGLLCRSNDCIWVLVMGSEGVTEEDISEFSRECRKYRNKLQRKILVTTGDLDHNSHLKAMDEKIITWDLNRVNQLLDLFSKPRIISRKPEKVLT